MLFSLSHSKTLARSSSMCIHVFNCIIATKTAEPPVLTQGTKKRVEDSPPTEEVNKDL